MKRHPALAPLSRDHHHALVLARRLRRADEQDAAGAARAFLEHWMVEERRHFRLEEEVLLPALAAYDDPDHPAVIRTLLDHVRIRAEVERLGRQRRAGAAPRARSPVGRSREGRGERAVPLIERTVPEAALVALGDRLGHASRR
jgi:hypothetical protein